MTDQEVLKIIESENLKNGEYVLLTYISAVGKKITFVSRLRISKENGVLMIGAGYLIHKTQLTHYIKMRRANIFDKIFREYWGNSSDSRANLFKRS
jgi:hypothetical protein